MNTDSISHLKMEISELQKQLVFARESLESASSIVLRWDKDGIIHFMNDFGLRFFGYSSEELIGQQVMTIVPKIEKSTGRDMSKLAKDISIDPDKYKSVPSENITKDGRTVWVTWTNKGFFDEQGNVQEILAIGNDVTALKEAEQKNFEYQEKLGAALESMDDAVFISDSQGNFVHFNKAFATFHRFIDKSECFGRLADYPKILDVFLPDGELLSLDQWAVPMALRGENATNVEYTLHRKDTGETWVGSYNFGPIFDQQGNIAGAVVVARDITERKRAEEILEQSHDLLSKLARLVPGVIYQYRLFPDGSSAFPYSSPGMDDIYEVSPEEVQEDATPVFGRLHPDDYDMVGNLIQVSAQTLKTFHCEFRVILPRQGHRWRWSQAHPERLDDGSTLWHGIISDITERKQSEYEKEQLQIQLSQAQKIESIGQLAGGVAHDFNNILGVILGHTELALRKLDPASPLISDLEENRKAANRAAELTRQLLTFARKQAITPKVLDLNESVTGTLKMLQRLIGENVQVSWNPAANLWPVKADPSQIDQILANLCVNSRDAISGTGKISIKTGNTSWDEDAVASRPYDVVPGDYVQLSVSDDGCGMDKKVQSHIFEPFYTTKESGSGTGLGLATVYGAVKQNHGFFTVYSEPGLGTVFNIYFPRTTKAVEAEQETPETQLIRGNETVLLVEDDEMLLQLVTTMLEESGYTVLAADTTDLAQTIAKEHPGPIHLLISDVVMPVMNGKDLSEKLQPLRPEMKVLFLSGYTADIISKQGVIEDKAQFLQKPFSLEGLTSKVRKILDDH